MKKKALMFSIFILLISSIAFLEQTTNSYPIISYLYPFNPEQVSQQFTQQVNSNPLNLILYFNPFQIPVILGSLLWHLLSGGVSDN